MLLSVQSEHLNSILEIIQLLNTTNALKGIKIDAFIVHVSNSVRVIQLLTKMLDFFLYVLYLNTMYTKTCSFTFRLLFLKRTDIVTYFWMVGILLIKVRTCMKYLYKRFL